MKKYDTYKDSGIQWIGQVPEHWATFPLSKYIVLQKGRKPKELTTEGEVLPYVTMDYLRGRENATCQYPVSVENLISINENDLLLLWDGANAGEVVKAKQGYLASTMAVLKFADKIGSSQFLFYYLKSLEAIFKKFANGTTIPHFDSSVLFDYKYPLPPLAEQQVIANFLDKKTGEIDKAISLFEREKLDLQAYRKAIISETVTKGLNPNAKLKDSGIQWIGQIPEEWSVRKCSRVFDTIGSGQTPKSDKPIYYSEAGYNWLQTGDLNDSLISNTSKKISEEAMQDYNLTQYPVESVVVAMYGATIGKIGYLQIETTTNQACCVLNSKSVMRNKYAYYVFLSAKTELINMSNGGGQPNISQSIIRNFIIPLPPLSEQEAIVAFLDKKTSDIDTAIERINAQIAELQAYRTALISEAVTGKIDVR